MVAHDSRTLSWYSQLPKDATESSQVALSDIFYSRVKGSPNISRGPLDLLPDDPFQSSAVNVENTLQMPPHYLPQGNFDIQRVTNLKEIDPDWEDDEIDEVLILSRRRHAKKLSVIRESVDIGKPISISSFNLAQLLATGGFGNMYIGWKHGGSKRYSIKVIPQPSLADHELRFRATTEQKLLKHVTLSDIPFITRLYWSFKDNNSLYLITGYHPLKLQSLIKTDDPSFPQHVLFYAAELVDVISRLHSSGIMHRNVCTETVRIGEDGHIVLEDLSCAAFVGITRPDSPTPPVLDLTSEGVAGIAPPWKSPDNVLSAPEIVLGWKHDTRVDVWSFGVLLCVLLSGKRPPSADFNWSRDSGKCSSLNADVQFDGAGLDKHAVDLISQCIEQNPSLRPTIQAVKAHSYFDAIDWEHIQSKRNPAPLAARVLQKLREIEAEKPGNLEPLVGEETPGQEITQTIYPDDFSFEWREPEARKNDSVTRAATGTRACLSARKWTDNPTGTPSRTNQTAISGSVTSFGELRQALRSTTMPALRHSTYSSGASSTLSQTTKRQSGSTLSTEPPQRTRLRKYASLNFDLDTIVPLSQEGSDSESGAQVFRSAPTGSKTTPLSHLPRWSPLRSFKFPRTSSVSPRFAADENFLALDGAPLGTSKKLRKKSRTPVLPVLPQPEPIPDFPKGVERIGNGIGFTFTGSNDPPSVQNSAIISAATTPRRAMSLYGNLTTLPLRLLRYKKRSASTPNQTNGYDEREDTSDFGGSIRETYGSSWDLSSTGAALRSAAGLGFGLNGPSNLTASVGLVTPVRSVGIGEVFPNVPLGYSGPLGDSLFSGSTLRLVTPETRPEGA